MDDWNSMSEADKRRWAVEQVRFAERLFSSRSADMEVRVGLFVEADALIAYVEGMPISLPLSQEFSEAA